MFELLESNCAALSYEEILSDISIIYYRNKFEKCVMTVNALHNMVQDNYDRDELSSFLSLRYITRFLGGLTLQTIFH